MTTLKIGLLAGRDFDATDRPSGVPVVILNDTLARRLGAGSAVGQHVQIACNAPSTAEVVGVAHDSKVRSLQETAQPHLYRPFSQSYSGLATLVVESRVASSSMVSTIRRTLQEFGEGIRVYDVKPLADHVERSYWAIRWQARILAVFALVALGLATVGLYGITTYRVALRTREIGVRLALGASPWSVRLDVLRRGLILSVAGIAIGEAVSVPTSHLLSSLQTDVGSTDPGTYAAIAGIWLAVTVLACYIPARRASRLDPLVVLRAE